MRGRGGVGTALVVLLAALPTSAQEGAEAAPSGPEVWYAERISTGDAPVRVEHLWSKGPRLRAETVFVGHPIVEIVAGDRYVIFDRLTRRGVSIERSPAAVAEDATRRRPFANELEAMREAGAEEVGTETVAGRDCRVWRLTDDSGRREVCVGGDPPVPLFRRVWLRASGAEAVTRYLEWSRDLDVPDTFFEPPPDVQIELVAYDDYLRRAPNERLGPAPPMHRDLLHGRR